MKLLSELYNVSLDILLDDNVNLDEVSDRKRNSEDGEPTKTERQISNVQEQYTGKEPFQLESLNLYMFVLVSTIILPLGIVICMIVFFKALLKCSMVFRRVYSKYSEKRWEYRYRRHS